jgi:hypothetical protein
MYFFNNKKCLVVARGGQKKLNRTELTQPNQKNRTIINSFKIKL